MSEERKVEVEDLRPGMYVSRLDRPWLESPFAFQGFLLETWEQVAEVRGTCRYVYVEEGGRSADSSGVSQRRSAPTTVPRTEPNLTLTRQRPVDSVQADQAAPISSWRARLARELGWAPGPPPPVTVSLKEEIRAARPLIRETRDLVEQQVRDARNGRSLDTPNARECVQQITESILRNPDALVSLSALKKRDEYTYLHSLSVCILSVSLGRYLGLPRETLWELGFGAFLHDIGKMRIPDQVLNKPGHLSPEEMQVMRLHPQFGVEIVGGSESIPTSSRNAIFSHHERLDGSGYTEGVAGKGIHPLTHIVSVCDTYDAIISHRPYKTARAPLDATAELYRGRGRFFERELVQQFIGCIGIYPIGSLIELSTNEVGVVISSNEDRLRPKVLILLDEGRQPLKHPYEVDLSRTVQTAAGERLDVKRSLESEAYGLQTAELLDYLEEG